MCRNNLLYGLTRNLTVTSDRNTESRNIYIGGVPLCDIKARSKLGVSCRFDANYWGYPQ